MSRYKDRMSLAREFPFTVETAVPESGLGRTLDRMYEFHALHGIKAQTGAGRRVGHLPNKCRPLSVLVWVPLLTIR